MFLSLLASSNVSTVSQGIVRMQGLPFRATEDDIVSTLLNTVLVPLLLLCICLHVYRISRNIDSDFNLAIWRSRKRSSN